MVQKIALIAAIILPLWNIPLIVRMIKRHSSNDISIYWAVGVWFCLLAMFPAGIKSPDIIWKIYTYINFFFFTCVALCTLLFYNRK